MKMNNTCGVSGFAMWPVITGIRGLNPLTGETEDIPLANAELVEEHLKV
jgi:hypothetical protein